MAHTPSQFEHLISLDKSSDYDSSEESTVPNDSWQNSKTLLDPDLSWLKAQNINRLHQRWDEIIAKYLKIDDSKESDEIDLHTGKIITDNGHLRSFAEDGAEGNGTRPFSSIWAIDDRFEKESRKYKHAEKIRRRLRHEEQERLKATSNFYNKKMQGMDFGTRVLPDNILLLSPSPTKKHKTNTSSVLALATSSPVHTLSYGHRLNTPKTSPLKQKLPFLTSSPHYDMLESPLQAFHKNDNEYVLEKNLNTKTRLEHTQELRPNTGKEHQSILDNEHYEYDELFLITELSDPLPISLFKCAFYGCRYTSSSKASYRAHLISSHSPELKQIGYPVQTRKQPASFIPGDTIPKLHLHFPIQVDLPPDRPFTCGLQLQSGKCKKIFIDKKHLARHQEQCPQFCSTKSQVLVCPLLGCDFMTDTSYHEFYNHMKSHDCAQTESNLVDEQDHSAEEFDDYFSDSTSSISFSGSEKEDESLVKLQKIYTDGQQSPSKRLKINKPIKMALENVPKLNILDRGIDYDLRGETIGAEKGYSSIEELFQDDEE